MTMRIDFVSDVACPWCAIGLTALDNAIARIGAELAVEVHCQPFELNPDMPEEGADLAQYLRQKYGMGAEQLAAGQARLAERGAAEGFAFGSRTRVWNTFAAHRLLFAAGAEGSPTLQVALARALFAAYHGQGRNPGAADVLIECAIGAGLPEARAGEIVGGDAYAAEVRTAERFWQELGIHSVPAVIVERRHLISGGQPSAVFEQALRQIQKERIIS